MDSTRLDSPWATTGEQASSAPYVEVTIVEPRTLLTATVPRVAAAVPVAGLGGAVLAAGDLFRHGEAVLDARLLEGLFSRPAIVPLADPVFYYQATAGTVPVWPSHSVTGLGSASWFIGGMLVVTALMLLFWRRAPVSGLLVASLVTITTLAVVSTARTILVVEATARWGETGFGWMMHTVGGPALMIATLCLCSLLFTPGTLLAGARPTGDV
ncbi:hypothetical protein [Promicromonospora iranensis]|jgi:hypothetical protein|uniref:hypothetical protein n=1 Tax=Promicromonospora iranensis TaxID=1105144 RepID=UPI0023A99B37|nr:hypothetical protein [Promicromonospora iranensis]